MYEHLTDLRARNRRIAYKTWYHMHNRCACDPRYKSVTIDPSWNDFEIFYHDMGDRPSDDHSLDRINGSLIYSKSTCKWSTRSEQSSNRPGFTIDLMYQGRIICLRELCRELNLKYMTVYKKLRANKPLTQIFGNHHDSIKLVPPEHL